MNARDRSGLRQAICVGFALMTSGLSGGCREDLPKKAQADPLESASGAAASEPAVMVRSPSGRRILVVHSYHPEYPWVAAITRGIQRGLEDSRVQIEIFYMDTKRKTDEQWKVKAGELAGRKVDEYAPDLVITADDNAQQYFARRYVGRTLPFVFCGVNADPSKYGYPAPNVTGVIERPSFRSAVDYAHMLRPFRRIAVLSSNDETSMAALGFMRQELVDAEVTEYKLVGDFDEWKQTVERYNRTVEAFAVYMYHTVKDRGNATSLEPGVVMRWTAEHATIPTVGLFEFGIQDGLLVGVVESGEEQGEKAARCALAILRGTPVSSLPVLKGETGIRMINRRTAAHLGIPITAEAAKDAVLVPPG